MPTDGAHVRLLRTGTLASILVARGHEVVWWTSTFDHARKRARFNADTLIDISNRFRINLLHSVPYRKNVSVSRIVNHCGVARKFLRLAGSDPKPDLILCSLPTLELSSAATEYGKERCIPVVLDVRDLWPDLFVESVPVWGQRIVRLLLYPMFAAVRSACSKAAAITGVTPAFVDWGVSYANRPRTHLDRDFPLGYSNKVPSKEAIMEAERFWEKQGVTKSKHEFITCFFGTMGRQFELETAIEGARRLKLQNRPFRFILCGSGENLAFYKRLANGCENVVFPGWVGAAEIWTLMRMSSVGLAPYRSSSNFINNLPNKPIEYLSAGLPIVSSLKGILKDLLSNYDCGVSYENGNGERLASALSCLYDQPERLRTLSENARALYQEKFVAEKVYGEMSDYLEEVAGTK